jgi:hypothetical protein
VKGMGRKYGRKERRRQTYKRDKGKEEEDDGLRH